MATTIFYSWQSDHPSKEGRNFIEKALEKAIENLSSGIELQEAVREQIELDRDTKNVPGSPNIFHAILEKIEKAALIVSDLTFVANRPNGDPTPNPNVLIEYGYALGCLGERRVIQVMNTAYGEPSRETMPFDLLQHRHPITYHLPASASEEDRKAAKNGLVSILQSAIKTYFESDDYKRTLPMPAPVAYREPKHGRARFRPRREAIGTRSDLSARIKGLPEEKLFLAEGPCTWLRVGPKSPPAKLRKITKLQDVINKLALLPFYDPGQGIGGVWGSDGCGFYNNYGPLEPAPGLVYVFTDDEIWTINTLRLSIRPDLILLDEAQFVKSLAQCVAFLNEQLGASGPYRCVAGMEDVMDRYLWEDDFRRKSGQCSVGTVEVEEFFKLGDSLQDVLEPFFEEVFDKCGMRRPERAAAM